MLRLTTRRCAALSATVRELANYGVVAFVFSQFVGQAAVSWPLILTGGVLWLAFVIFA